MTAEEQKKIPRPVFSEEEYDQLHTLVFRDDYPGYKPTVKEIPNGDGKVDADKRYAHVATKYFATQKQRMDLLPFLQRAHSLAMDVATALRIPPEFQPKLEYSALRILDYPPGATSNEHEDFDLFTLMLYRDQPDRFVSKDMGNHVLREMRFFNMQAHIGQLGTEIGLGQATPHSVLPSTTSQHSIVYFAIPDHGTTLPGGTSVLNWLNERMARSRTEFKKYE
jgi:hypothetical protein